MKSERALTRQLTKLRAVNSELKNNLELKNQSVLNAISSLMSPATNQTSLNSLTNLAYFNAYAPLTINWTLLTYMYKTHGLLQTAIDMPVLDALRGGIDIHSDQLSPEDIKLLQDRLEHTGVIGMLGETAIWARLYGGAGVVINVDQDPAKPLDMKKVNRLDFYAASRWEIQSVNRFSDTYEFYGKKIHHSRVLTMAGKAAPYLIKFVLQGWGMSEMERMIEDFNLYLRTKDVIYELLKEAKVDVYRFENFTTQLASGQAGQLTTARVQLMNQLKAYNNAVVMDKNDEFEQKQITFAGLAEVHKQNMVYVASALRMPMTKLFGISSAGFNSGEDDIENYNAMVESEVRQPMRPLIRGVLDLICLQEFGDTFDLDFSYKPLRMLGLVEEEVVKTSKYNRYKGMFDDGLMDPKEYAELMHDEKLVPMMTSVAKGGELFDNRVQGDVEADEIEPGTDEEKP